LRGGSFEPPLFSTGEFLSAFGRLIPLLTIVVALFALFQLFTAIMYLAQKQYIGASVNLVFSFAGLALARALWTNRKKLM
jgi:hypothetical protein